MLLGSCRRFHVCWRTEALTFCGAVAIVPSLQGGLEGVGARPGCTQSLILQSGMKRALHRQAAISLPEALITYLLIISKLLVLLGGVPTRLHPISFSLISHLLLIGVN